MLTTLIVVAALHQTFQNWKLDILSFVGSLFAQLRLSREHFAP